MIREEIKHRRNTIARYDEAMNDCWIASRRMIELGIAPNGIHNDIDRINEMKKLQLDAIGDLQNELIQEKE